MTTLDALNNVADVLRSATENLKLDKAESLPGTDKVPPNVCTGYAPPRNTDMSMYNGGYHAPCIVVGLGENGGNDDGKDATIPVMVTFGTYSPGQIKDFGQDADDNRVQLDNEGFIDLLNLIECARTTLLKKTVLKRTTVERPVQWGMYPDQPYPYWYGWVSFDAKVDVEEMQLPRDCTQFL